MKNALLVILIIFWKILVFFPRRFQNFIATVLGHFIDFRHEIVVRRTEFELKEAEARAHILEGLKIALDNISELQPGLFAHGPDEK